MRGGGIFETIDDFHLWQNIVIIQRKHQGFKDSKGRKGRDISGGGHGTIL
jgi:hypothetical protein